MIHKTTRLLLMTSVVASLSAVTASAMAGDRLALTQSCEIAIARSALPERLREGASVYALVGKEDGKVVEGEGNFTCIVARNHPDSVIPQCVDDAGVDSVLHSIIDKSEMWIAGTDEQELRATIKDRHESGHYKVPARSGINYMMSDYNYIYVNRANSIMKIPPHVMFYAPNVSNDDIGGSFENVTQNLGTPFVIEEGPHGYMITYTEHAADPNEVAMACTGQLGERPPSFRPAP